MNTKVLILLGLIAVVAADKLPTYFYSEPQDSLEEDVSDEAEPPKYDFAFGVKDDYSGADFAHQEARDEDETRGSYYVQLPDGRLQRVTYYVDGDGGYVAEVSYEGEAQYPESQESQEAPVYAPPRPSYGYPQ